MKKKTTPKTNYIKVDSEQLAKLMGLAAGAMDCLYEYGGDESSTYEYLKKEFDKWTPTK
jgi:hypothetical protein